MKNASFKKIKDLISSKELKIAVIGVGYVGLPLLIKLGKSGFHSLGFDKNLNLVNSLNEGKSLIRIKEASQLKNLVKRSIIKFSNNPKDLRKFDAFIICVPTPLDSYNQPDISAIKDAILMIKALKKKNIIISLESTTYPGTTREEILEKFNNTHEVGKNIFIGFSPEREDPGNEHFDVSSTPKIVSGATHDCLEIIGNLYSTIVKTIIPVTSLEVAEMTKLLENIHRSVNIGLVNEIKKVTDSMGIDIFEVINAANTKPFGFTAFYPGPGLGGHCIPIDPFYLNWKAKSLGVQTKFIELAGEINTSMPDWVVNRGQDILNKSGISLKKAKILILGVSYKKNVSDIRESPGIRILEILTEKGSKPFYSDPLINSILVKEKKVKSIKLNSKILESFDLIMLIADHDNFDYKKIQKHAKKILDTRGRFSISLKKVSRG